MLIARSSKIVQVLNGNNAPSRIFAYHIITVHQCASLASVLHDLSKRSVSMGDVELFWAIRRSFHALHTVQPIASHKWLELGSSMYNPNGGESDADGDSKLTLTDLVRNMP